MYLGLISQAVRQYRNTIIVRITDHLYLIIISIFQLTDTMLQNFDLVCCLIVKVTIKHSLVSITYQDYDAQDLQEFEETILRGVNYNRDGKINKKELTMILLAIAKHNQEEDTNA